MNRYSINKRIFVALALVFALSTSHMTYPIFDWLDTMRDKLSEPILGKVTKDIDKKDTNTLKPTVSSRSTVKSQIAQQQAKIAPKAPESLTLSIAEVLTQVYCTEGIETPINRIGAQAAVKTGYEWFGRKISSRQVVSQLAESVFVSAVMFSVHNLAAYFLYPNWLKDRWWAKGFADSLCSSMVMGLAGSLFGTSLNNND